jgi:hypothetical protein
MAAGIVIGHLLRDRTQHRESLSVVQATLLGFVGLLLAFGLTQAVSRYDTRRSVVVDEANSISTAYLRAQLLPEPTRTAAIGWLRQYADAAVVIAHLVPSGTRFERALDDVGKLQGEVWTTAETAQRADPTGVAPLLYVQSLNEMFDASELREASLRSRVPTTVAFLDVFGSAVALAVLALYLTMLGRSVTMSVLAGVMVVLILLVSFDLDRPHRGIVNIPTTPIEDVRAQMDQPVPVP